jgi:hypothetical protein
VDERAERLIKKWRAECAMRGNLPGTSAGMSYVYARCADELEREFSAFPSEPPCLHGSLCEIPYCKCQCHCNEQRVTEAPPSEPPAVPLPEEREPDTDKEFTTEQLGAMLPAPPVERDTRTGEELQRRARELWRSLPHCCGYPECDGDLVATPHSQKCPLFGRVELSVTEFGAYCIAETLRAGEPQRGKEQG